MTMKTIATAAAATVFAIGASAVSAGVPGEYNRGEEKLAKILEGHVQSGEPESCITTYRNRNLQVVENVGFVYDAGKTIWVARSLNPKGLGHWDVPVIDRFSSSQLCKNDRITTVDRSTGMFTGIVFLDEFVPYTRVEDADS